MASSQRTIEQATGTAPTIGVAVGERTHYAHARYAMIDEPGVIWFDPRDGHEKFQVPNTPAGVDLSLDERVLTHVTIHAKRARCQIVDPAEHEWVVEYQVKTREVFERPPEVPDREYTAHYAKTETYDTVRAARAAAGERCDAYADAPYRNAVEARTGGELVTDGGYRPPCEAVAHMDPTPPNADEYDLERRACPNCRLYFDVGAETDNVFCSGACRKRHERGELIADGGTTGLPLPKLETDGGTCYEPEPVEDIKLSRTNIGTALPKIRFVDRFETGDDVFYAVRRENGVRLYRVTGKTTIVRGLLAYDAVIHEATDNPCLTTPSYNEKYHTIDLNHHMAGRTASFRADRILDKPVITLAEVNRV